MNIDSILALHRKYQKKTDLSQVLGDGYLYNCNSIFRNIRNTVHTLGYTFTDKDFCNYRSNSLRLASLPKILRERKIPFQNTYMPMKDLSLMLPRQISTDNIYYGADTPLLHESSHCIAEDLFSSIGILNTNSKKVQDVVLRAAVAEAFALATDAMACLHARQKTHVIFYSFNSYLKPDNVLAIQKILRSALQSLGFQTVYKVLIYSAILKIFLQEKLTNKNTKLLLTLTKINNLTFSEEQLRQLKIVSSIWLRPSGVVEKDFYTKVSTVYFTMVLGKRADLKQLYSFSPLEAIQNTDSLETAISLLVKTAQSGLETDFSTSIAQNSSRKVAA